MGRIVVALAALAVSIIAAPAASALTVGDGYTVALKYHLGDINQGYISTQQGVELRYNPRPFLVTGASGYGVIEKGAKVSRVQIDFVRLGRVAGGVLAENLQPVNSGVTGASAISSTVKYSPVASVGCAVPTQLWTRVGYSVRWTDGTLSKWTQLGPPTTAVLCTR